MQQENVSLVDIVTEWIKRDPLLSKHIHFEKGDRVPGDGLYLGGCDDEDGISYAIGYIAGGNGLYDTITWNWQFLDRSSDHVSQVSYQPGDPHFFEYLKIGLINGHNSLAEKTKCRI
jgi:hypothetical protein